MCFKIIIFALALLTETGECMVAHCPVDSFWNSWQQWTKCSSTCGSGSRARKRECPDPQFGGLVCSGTDKEVEKCTLTSCAGEMKEQ